MGQRFITKAKDGYKRILILDGQLIGAINLVLTGQEFLDNMAVAGRS